MLLGGAMLTLALAAPAAVGQEKAPGRKAPPKETPPQARQPAVKDEPQVLTVDAWTCPDHGQFRMAARGTCPLCRANLVKAKVALQGPDAWAPYPLDTCPVSGLKLGQAGPAVVMMYEGRELRFCCGDCIGKFEADPKKYLEQVDRKVIEQQLPFYPLTTCMVSEESLDSRTGAVDKVIGNRLVRFCCNGCVRATRKDPAAVLAKLDQAIIASQKAEYPLTTCMVSEQKLGSMGEPVDLVVGNRLVRFCCAGCPGAFYKEPAKYLARLEEAWKKTGRKHAGDEDGDDDDDEGDDDDDDRR
jgi:YHS domain-containing protein